MQIVNSQDLFSSRNGMPLLYNLDAPERKWGEIVID